MTIYWTDLAIEDYSECITYLEKQFSFEQVLEFIQKMDDTIALIHSNPNTFPDAGYKNVKLILVIPQVTIFYTPGKQETKILRVWNNRKDKAELKL